MQEQDGLARSAILYTHVRFSSAFECRVLWHSGRGLQEPSPTGVWCMAARGHTLHRPWQFTLRSQPRLVGEGATSRCAIIECVCSPRKMTSRLSVCGRIAQCLHRESLSCAAVASQKEAKKRREALMKRWVEEGTEDTGLPTLARH
eukprot:2884727-Amphidinium_carterae.1